MLSNKKKRVFEIIQLGYDEDVVSRGFDFLIMIMILTNLFIAIFVTFDQAEPYMPILTAVEFITVVVFAVEYCLRVWTAEYLFPRYSKKKAVWKYMTSFNGIIDVLAFLPYFLPIFFPAGVVAFRMFRVVRIFRLFRINAYYDALNVIGDVIKGKKDQIVSSIFIILVLMTASSLFMYSLENTAQPETFSNAFSGFWWAVSTLLTVGYGDIYPITTAGKIFGIIITFLGVGMVAIPTGILSAGFVEQYTRLKNSSDYSSESEIRFVRLIVETDDHPWINKQVKDLPLPPGLLIAVIQRDDSTIVPHGDTVVEKGDAIVIGAEGYQGEAAIHLKEITLKERHPWVGEKIRDLDISRQTLIIMVRRDGNLLVPDGSLELKTNDLILLYTKKLMRDMVEVDI